MPKQKTHRASTKCFERTGSSGSGHFRTFTSHRFHGKTKKQHRHFHRAAVVYLRNFRHTEVMLPGLKQE